MSENRLPISVLVKRIKAAYGMTWKEMGSTMGRSEKMMRKLATGQTSGENYRASLEELHDHGTVEHLTPRRRTKDGTLAPVRAKKGAETKSVVPTDTRGSSRSSPARTRWAHRTQFLPGGARQRRATFNPKSGTPTNTRGNEAFKNDLRSTTRSQSRVDKRVKVTVTVKDSNGRLHDYAVGSKSGFHASDVLSDIRTDHGGNSFGWMKRQLDQVYPDTGGEIVGYQTTEFSANRTKTARQAEDVAGTRRRRWRR